MDFQATEDDPLQAALATAFTDLPILSSRPSTLTSISQPPDPQSAQEQVEEGGGGDGFWKEEYDQHLSHWRAESAVARDKAEQERERWRLIRQQEQQTDQQGERGKLDSVQRQDYEWEAASKSFNTRKPVESAPEHAVEGGQESSLSRETVATVHDTSLRSSTTPPDAREVVTRETPRGHSADTIENPVTTPHSTTDDHGLSSSRTWEEVPSDDSSFPSLSFPERSAAASPDPRERPLYQQPPAPPSVTLAIFDSSLSCRARTLALISSIGINIFLPFVNGVMLGLGEIFAKNVVNFFGWNSSTAVGLRAAPRKR